MSGSMSDMKLFAGNANPELASRVAEYLGVSLGSMTAVTPNAQGVNARMAVTPTFALITDPSS